MPFEQVPTVAKAPKATQCSISYMRLTHSDAKNDRPKRLPRLIIGIPRGILGNFKPNKDKLYELHVGTGKDAGKARIIPGGAGVAPSTLKYCVVFRFGFVPMLGDEIADKEFINGRAIDGGYEIDLPAWFKPIED